jgi:hypothetical protein
MAAALLLLLCLPYSTTSFVARRILSYSQSAPALVIIKSSVDEVQAINGVDLLQKHDRSPLQFSCPADAVNRAPENYDKSFVDEYEIVAKILTNNTTELREILRRPVDGWGQNYADSKCDLREWKVQQFAPHLKNGSTMFESACGVGRNLYMTLEIAQEVNGAENIITVYGNDYFAASAEMANNVFNMIPPANTQLGTIGAGDSMDLSYVPANAFDLVYTGYIRYVRTIWFAVSIDQLCLTYFTISVLCWTPLISRKPMPRIASKSMTNSATQRAMTGNPSN